MNEKKKKSTKQREGGEVLAERERASGEREGVLD